MRCNSRKCPMWGYCRFALPPAVGTWSFACLFRTACVCVCVCVYIYIYGLCGRLIELFVVEIRYIDIYLQFGLKQGI